MLARQWASEADFGRAIVVGQMSPGPNGLWVISLGYFTGGILGAFLALLAISVPPLLVLVIARSYAHIEGWPRSQGAMRGVSIAVLGLLLTVIWTILRQPAVDGRGLVIAVGAFGLALTRKINILLILVLAGIVGYLVYR
jgi:chromate transporter